MPLTRRSKAKKALKPTEVKIEEENASDETSSEMKLKEESTSDTTSTSSKRKVKEEVVLDEEALKRQEIQSLWKVPAIAQFVSLYRFAFKLPEIEIEELEDGILDASAVGSKIVMELLVNILRSINPCKGINADNFEEHLRRIANKIKATGECANVNLSEEVRFIQLDLESKVDLLYSLCLTRLDRPDVLDAMKDMDAETLRVQPLGCDDLGNEYWYFYGTRLYKQEPSKLRKRNWQDEWADQKNQSFGRRGRGRPKKNSISNSENENTSENKRYMNIDEKSRWSVACNTIEDWVTFAEKLKKSKSKCERALFLTITDNFLPVLNEIYQEKERKLQEKLRELIPVHVPRRMETRRMTRKVTNPDMDAYDDNAHKEHLARDRAHRLEERNRRLAREDRSSSRSRRRTAYYDDDFVDDFYDDYEEAPPQQNQSVPQSNTSDRTKEQIHQYVPLTSSSRNDLKTKVLHVLSEVKLQKDSWPFLGPVEEAYAPGYYDIIENPMDLQTMSRKLLQNEYQTVNDIDKDFELMVSNCKLYNGEYHEMTKMVISLWKVFRKGLTKAFGSKSEEKDDASEPPAKIQRTSNDCDTQDASYENKFPEPTKKPKKPSRSRTKEALEVLSREADLAVEKTQRSPDFSQIDTRELVSHPSQYSMYSDLKIVPINNHPSSLIEKFSSDSSNHDDDIEMDGAPRYLNDESTSAPPVINNSANQEPPVQSRRTTPTIHFMNSDFSELMDKAGSSNNDGAGNPEAPNENDLNSSAVSLSSLSSTSPNLSGQERNSSPHLPAIPEENPPSLQQSSYSSLSDLANFTSSFESSTVNVAALGLPSSLGSYKKPYSNSQVPMTTSFGNYSQAPISSVTVQAPMRMNPELSMPPLAQNQGVQVTRESTQMFQAQRSNVTMSYPSSHHHQVPMVTTAQPSKAFPDPGNVVVQSQGENKFPNLKFNLPPSNGEILLVPGDPASSGMTFHLYAQPTSNQSQPIQSSIELKHGSGSSPIQHFSNQQAINTMSNQVLSPNQMSRGETTIRPQKRKSPHLLDQQDSPMPKTQTTTSLPYPASSLPKTSDSTASTTKTSEMAPIRQPVYANSLNSVLQSSAPQQRPVYNQYNLGKSAFHPRANLATTRTSVPLQQTGDSYPQRTMATVMPSVLCTTAMAAGSVMSRPSNMTVKTLQIPNGLVQSGQLIYVQPANREKRLPGEEQVGKMQSLGAKPVVTQAVTSSPYLQSANTNVMMQSAAFQNGSINPSQVYTQVVPSQIQPQFINNNPYYIIADPNAFQGAQRYPVMNVQHVPFNNR